MIIPHIGDYETGNSTHKEGYTLNKCLSSNSITCFPIPLLYQHIPFISLPLSFTLCFIAYRYSLATLREEVEGLQGGQFVLGTLTKSNKNDRQGVGNEQEKELTFISFFLWVVGEEVVPAEDCGRKKGGDIATSTCVCGWTNSRLCLVYAG